MYLKRLELVGFKSFATKTVLEFPGGVTAVVGPNGSGKSNIIDAIRWLLGEREAKNVRGLKAEDLIFAGNPKRPRLSMAQVTLVFDNTNNFFPVEYREVAIKRRVSRDGVSDYFINDVQVRLKDIIDFFAQSRLGTKGFTIINQGDSDLFVRSAPPERRAMLEEILGLRQYQLKKHEAENKLKSTRINLDKVKALLEEIAPHLRMLKRQTGKWEKHDELASELHALENQYFRRKLDTIRDEEARLKPEFDEIEKKLHGKVKELEALEEKLHGVEKSAPTKNNSFVTFQTERAKLLETKSKLQKEVGRIEAQLEFFSEQSEIPADPEALVSFLEETKANVESLIDADDNEEIKAFLSELVSGIENLLSERKTKDDDEKVKAIEKAKDKIVDEIDSLDEALEELVTKETQVSGNFENFNLVFKQAYEEVEAKKNEISAIKDHKNKILIEKERALMRVEELHREMHQGGRTEEEFMKVTLDEGFEMAKSEHRILRLRGELAGMGEVDEAVMKEAKETEERHAFLEHQSADLEKAFTDLTGLIKELDQKIHKEFNEALKKINGEFNTYFQMMFGGGKAHLALQKPELKPETEGGEGENLVPDTDESHTPDHGGIEIEVSIPRKRITGLDMLSGGEKSLVSIAALFALISVSPPPFLVLDEADAALDEQNTRRFAKLVKDFSGKTQFVIVTHNRATMEAANLLYGVTMEEDGISKVLSLKLE